jgi:hypothetical protein
VDRERATERIDGVIKHVTNILKNFDKGRSIYVDEGDLKDIFL